MNKKYPQQEILGEYKIKIERDGEDREWYIAEVTFPDGYICWTQGINEEEILEMVADLIMTVLDMKVCWWNKFLYRFMIFKKHK